METIYAKLTVLFETPFWVGLYERQSCGQYEVCKITFGAEPKDYEVYEFILQHWAELRFSPSLSASPLTAHHKNPKRLQREIKKQMENNGVSTKAQQAIQLQREQGKLERKTKSRTQREAEQVQQFTLRQEKRKKKHRGH